MEPKSHESLPTPIEQGPNVESREQPPASLEHLEASPEQSQERRQLAMPAQPTVQLPTPVVAAPSQSTAHNPVMAADDEHPAVAADEDLIEKEWVDKAKKIVNETRNDPRAREQRVGRLQADYLKKRYGKELGNQT